MDEHEGDLRILSTQSNVHRLTVLRESDRQRLDVVSRLPSTARPAPIGKPGESVFAVRFMAERAYVVTFRVIDPLYVIDLSDPADPVIAGELAIPGFSTYLRPVGANQSELLLSVGQDVTAGGRRAGVKVELFDVRDIAHPQSLGAKVLGSEGSQSIALADPHALTFLTLPGDRHRLALPVHVVDSVWTYSGLHLFEVARNASGTSQLHFQGVIKTDEPASRGRSSPTYAAPDRGILHGDSIFSVYGDQIRSSLWQDVTP
jgi:Beta propeller domain